MGQSDSTVEITELSDATLPFVLSPSIALRTGPSAVLRAGPSR